MTTFRITVRGDGTELRGYLRDEGGENLALLSEQMKPLGVVIASELDAGTTSLPITNDPSPETSYSIITGLLEQANGNPAEFIATVAHMHYMQAMVIRGERDEKEEAMTELGKRELHHFETEQVYERAVHERDAALQVIAQLEGIIHRIKQVRSNFPEKCEVHDEDEITCGWKHMIAGMDKVLADA